MAEQDEDQFQSQSIGERLKRARDDRGLSLEDVASQTRIPVRHLQNIENNEWDALPSVTYCTGFVRAYAGVVGLDGPELSRELRDQVGGIRPRTAPAEYYEPADPARVPPRSLAVIAAIIAVVLIVGYMLWRGSLDDGEQSAEVTPTVQTVAPTPQTPRPAAPAPAPQAVAGEPVALTAVGEVWLRVDEPTGGPALFQGVLLPGQRFDVPATAQQPQLRTARPQMLRITIGSRDLGLVDSVERSVANVSLRAEDLAARGQSVPPAPPAGAPPPPAPVR